MNRKKSWGYNSWTVAFYKLRLPRQRQGLSQGRNNTLVTDSELKFRNPGVLQRILLGGQCPCILQQKEHTLPGCPLFELKATPLPPSISPIRIWRCDLVYTRNHYTGGNTGFWAGVTIVRKALSPQPMPDASLAVFRCTCMSAQNTVDIQFWRIWVYSGCLTSL